MSENGDGETEMSSHFDTNKRLLVTHEGFLDPSLLIRTEGFMHKKGGAVNSRGGLRNWKKRWFVIAPVEFFGTQGYELQYFDAPGGNLKGKVGLSEIELFVETKSTNKKVKYEFQILLQNNGVLELSCDNSQEREEWIETLSMIIAYLRKVLTSSSMTLDGYDPLFEDDENVYRIGEEISQNCQAFGPGLFGSEAGAMTQFVIQIHDLVGQQVTKGGMPITATITNAECLYYLRIQDNDDGTYLAQYTLGAAGVYSLAIKLNDEHHIFGSPFHIEILPSKTVAKFCSASGNALNQIRARSSEQFLIHAKDGFGNVKTRGNDAFEVGVMGPAQLKSLVDNNNGTYTCEIEANSSTAVNYVASSSLMIYVTLQGKHIAGSPFKPIIVEDLYANMRTGGPAGTPRGLTGNGNSAPAPYLQQSNGHQSGTSRDEVESLSGSVTGSLSLRNNTNNMNTSNNTAGSVRGNNGAGLNSTAPLPVTSHNNNNGSPIKQSLPHSNAAGGANGFNNTTPNMQFNSAPLSKMGSTNAGTPGNAKGAAPPTAADGTLSRLERARQRALFAKSLNEGGVVSHNQSVQSMQFQQQQQQQQQQQAQQHANQAQAQYPLPTSSYNRATLPPNNSHQNSQQDLLSNTGAKSVNSALLSTAPAAFGANNSSASRLTQLAQRNASNLNVLKKTAAASASAGNNYETKESSSSPTRSAANVDVSAVLSALRLGLGNDNPSGGTTLGISSSAPVNASQEEQYVWDVTHKALTGHEVVSLLANHLDTLKRLFDVFADTVEGVSVVKLTTSLGNGVLRILECYEVVPSFVTKIEVKVLFSLIAHAQRNLRTPASVAGGGTGLDFASFLKLLVMVAAHALSKTAAFSSMYSTTESKVEVMLFKWGLADAVKLQIVSRSGLNAPLAGLAPTSNATNYNNFSRTR